MNIKIIKFILLIENHFINMATKNNFQVVGTMLIEFIHEVVANNVPNNQGVQSVFTRGVNQLIEQLGLSPISHMGSMNYGEVSPFIDKAQDTKIYVCLKNRSDNINPHKLSLGKKNGRPRWSLVWVGPQTNTNLHVQLTETGADKKELTTIDEEDKEWVSIENKSPVVQPASLRPVSLLIPASTLPFKPQRQARARVVDLLFPQSRQTSLSQNAGGM